MKLSHSVELEFRDSLATMHMTQEQVIEIAIIKLYADRRNFIICPMCGDYLGIRDAVDGERDLKCRCGKVSQIATRKGPD